MTQSTAAAEQVPGGQADKPTDIPPEGWKQIVKRAFAESKADHVPLLAGGVAYAAFLAIFPALIAAISVYGLLVEPAEVRRQIEDTASALPNDAKSLITSQLTSIASGPKSALGLSLIISVAVALWAASGGVMGLMNAVNVAYDEEDKRKFFKKRGLALLLTVGGIILFGICIALVAVLPPVLNNIGLGAFGRIGAEVLRWVLLIALVMGALSIVYRLAPDRDSPKMKWASLGAIVATVLWAIASVGFSLYVNNFGKYGKTYGALAGVVVLMIWLYWSAYIILLGAEINAEAEQQTAKDTTKGEEKPLGERGAVKADSMPGDETSSGQMGQPKRG